MAPGKYLISLAIVFFYNKTLHPLRTEVNFHRSLLSLTGPFIHVPKNVLIYFDLLLCKKISSGKEEAVNS